MSDPWEDTLRRLSNYRPPFHKDGLLASVSDEVLAFWPGSRTSDFGSLTATLLDLDAGPPVPGAWTQVVLDTGPLSWDQVTWTITDVFDSGFSVQSVTQSRSQHERDGLLIHAGSVRQCRLKAELQTSSGVVRGSGSAILSVPAHVEVSAIFSDVSEGLRRAGLDVGAEFLWDQVVARMRLVTAHILRPLNIRLHWKTSENASPAPAQFSDFAAIDLNSDFCYGTVGGSGGTTLADGLLRVVIGDSAVTGNRQLSQRFRSSLAGAHTQDDRALNLPSVDTLEAALGNVDVVWSVDAGWKDRYGAAVRLGFGVRTPADIDVFGNNLAPVVDSVLLTLVQDARSVGFGILNVKTVRLVELWARVASVAVARAVTTLVGLKPASEDPTGADLMADNPTDTLRLLLGLSRGDENSVQLPTSDLVNDLEDQLADPSSHDHRSKWSDLVSYQRRRLTLDPGRVDPRLEDPELMMRPLNDRSGVAERDRLTPYDVLAGIATEDTVNQAQALLPLPLPHGGELTFGDYDAFYSAGIVHDPRSGGRVQAPKSVDERHHIRALQFDLWQVGIRLGLEPHEESGDGLGRFGSLALSNVVPSSTDHSHWKDLSPPAQPASLRDPSGHTGSTLKHRFMAGTTSFALRELSIADRYPNRVFERLSCAPHAPRPTGGVGGDLHRHRHEDGLVVVEQYPGSTPPNPSTQASPASSGAGWPLEVPAPVPGTLTRNLAWTLQRWRFTRRRYPVVFAARHATTQAVVLEQFMGPRAWRGAPPVSGTSPAPEKIDVIDLSGWFVPAFDPTTARNGWVLGQYVAHDPWGGPRRSSDLDTPVDDAGVLPNVDASGSSLPPGVAGADRPMMRVDRAATSEESADHFDNAQSWDDATFSLPLRHSTLTLTHNDALLGGFVRYLQDSDQQALRELYQLVFGNFGVGASRLDGTDRTAFLTVFGLSRPNASTVPGTSRDGAYQAYTQWFRSWPWFHRFIGAIRHSARMRRAMWAYELVMCDRVVGRIQGWNAANVDGRNLWSYLGRQAGNARVASATANEFEMAVGLRLWVRAHSLVDDWSDWLQEVHDVLGRTTTPQERISTIILGRNQTPADIANIGNSLGGPVTPAAPTTPRPPDPGGGAQWDQAMAAHTQAQNERNRLLAAIGNLQTLSKKIDSIRDWFNVALPNGLATALSNAGPTAAERQTAIDNATNSAVHEGLRD